MTQEALSERKNNLITLNIAFSLRNAVHGNGCRIFINDMKCRTEHGSFYYYPDVMLVYEKTDNAEFYKEQPCFIAEVQSPSTERIDRHEKWQTYSQIPSLKSYLLADSQPKKVDYFQGDEADAWLSGILEPEQSLDD